MAANKTDRSPRDLSVPETMKIAALLAELMPPGNLSSHSGETTYPTPSDHDDEQPGPSVAPPALEIEELDDAEPVAEPEPMQERPRPASPRGLSKTKFPVEFPTPPPMGRFKPDADLPPPLSMPSPSVAELLNSPDWKSDPLPEPLPADVPASLANSAGAAADPELIQLGDLSTAGFFAMANWRNDPAAVRRPRRADYGLDEQTLALARRNPFYVVGQPRRPETRTVADVLAEFVWE